MRTHGRSLVLGTTVVLGLLSAAVVLVTHEGSASSEAPAIQVAQALGGSSEGYTRAYEPRELRFPEDHGPHPDFRTEWWYWTGNLRSAEGREFGYQLTVFRSALSPEPRQRDSAWATRQVYMAHFALADIQGEHFHAFERFTRGALGLAGAQVSPFRVWVEDWSADSPSPTSLFPLRLSAQAEGVALHLQLEQGKPLVLQGLQGLSQKGPEPGNASYYYSFTRMPTQGELVVGDQSYTVQGLSWMDREWSTSALGPELEGWDWFALQLSDGSELMYYQLRRKGGGADRYSSGVWVPAQGEPVHLGFEQVQATVEATWQSPRSGALYPARWRLRVPSLQLELVVLPALPHQELPLSVRYWEGAVRLEGTRAHQPVHGRGYLEMTGYADRPPRRDSLAQ